LQTRTLHFGAGLSAPLYTDKKTTPALNVQIGSTTWYGYLTGGTAPGRLTVQTPTGQVYSLGAPPPTGYVTNGLIVHLDAMMRSGNSSWQDLSGNGNHFEFIGPAPTFGTKSITLNQTSQGAKSVNNLNLSGFGAVTVEIRFNLIDNTRAGTSTFEHTINWNTQAGGFGMGPQRQGGATRVNMCHSNHRGFVFDYTCSFNDPTSSHTHANIFSAGTVDNGRQAYIDGEHILTDNVINRIFTNAPFFIGTRGDTNPANHGGGVGVANIRINSLRIYSRHLSAMEICQNAWADYNRFGGAMPDC
jgi:hypothetical protein